MRVVALLVGMWSISLLLMTVWIGWLRDDTEILPQQAVVQLPASHRDLYHLNLYTGEMTILADNGTRIGTPQWSSNGREVAYTGFDSPFTDIYVSDATRQYSRRLTQDTTDNLRASEYPTWSPNGDLLAYGRGFRFVDMQSNRRYMYRVNVLNAQDASNIYRNLGPEVGFAGLQWSPRGDWIAASVRTELPGLWLYAPSAEHDPMQIHTEEIGAFAWSADGAAVYFIDERVRPTQLHRYALESGQTTTRDLDWLVGGQFLQLDASPTRDVLLLAANIDGLHLLDPQAGTYKVLSTDVVTQAQWSSDGAYILYHTDGGPLRLMTANGQHINTVYDGSVITFSLAPTIAYKWHFEFQSIVALATLLITLTWRQRQ